MMATTFEAEKVINISLNKIAASRQTRAGASLHKSLLVASVLHKARFVYVENAHHYHDTYYGVPPEPPMESEPRAPTPLPEHNAYQNDNTTNDLFCPETELISDGEDEPEMQSSPRKRRRVSEQETEAAVSSILPKKLKVDDGSECYYSEQFRYETVVVCSSCSVETSRCECSEGASELPNMEVDQITSLVSIFSFNKQQQSDLCSAQAYQPDPVGIQVVALTA